MHAPRVLRRRPRRPRVATAAPPAGDLAAAINDHLELRRQRWIRDIGERTAALDTRGPVTA